MIENYQLIEQIHSDVPPNVKFIYDFDTNPYLLEKFHAPIYDLICRLPFSFQEKIQLDFNRTNTLNNTDDFITFKVNYNETIDIITQSKYIKNESLPFHFNLLDDGILCDFIDATSLEDKLIKNSNRYMAWPVDFVSEIKKSGHSILAVFDKIKRTCYLLDPNGSLSYFDNDELGFIDYKNLIHKTMEFYSNMLAYEYLILKDIGIDVCVNYKINSGYQQKFFSGYCKGWTLFFMIMLISSPNSFEFTDYLKKFINLNINQINMMIEIFQVWLYWNYKFQNILESKITKPSF